MISTSSRAAFKFVLASLSAIVTRNGQIILSKRVLITIRHLVQSDYIGSDCLPWSKHHMPSELYQTVLVEMKIELE